MLVLTYLILLRAFRSVVPAAQGRADEPALGAATYGVLVLVFQHHWGNVLGFDQTPQIEAWIPIFLFAILFGLSMDYEVFLLSRMREEWDAHHDNEAAVALGLERTGRIITAAAMIMIAAFAGFTRELRRSQEFGVGLVGRDPARRDDRARDARAGDDEAARRLELVPARARAQGAAAEAAPAAEARSPQAEPGR